MGKIYFLLVRIKIKHMELSIIRRETTGAAPNQYNESETITKFEIMDGAPVRGKISDEHCAALLHVDVCRLLYILTALSLADCDRRNHSDPAVPWRL